MARALRARCVPVPSVGPGPDRQLQVRPAPALPSFATTWLFVALLSGSGGGGGGRCTYITTDPAMTTAACTDGGKKVPLPLPAPLCGLPAGHAPQLCRRWCHPCRWTGGTVRSEPCGSAWPRPGWWTTCPSGTSTTYRPPSPSLAHLCSTTTSPSPSWPRRCHQTLSPSPRSYLPDQPRPTDRPVCPPRVPVLPSVLPSGR